LLVQLLCAEDDALSSANSGSSGSPWKFPVNNRSRQQTEVTVAVDGGGGTYGGEAVD
jgi:hypothetical protein